MSQLLLVSHHSTLARRYSRGEEDAALPTLLPARTVCTPEVMMHGSKLDLTTPMIRRASTGAALLAPLGRVAALLCGWMNGRGTDRLGPVVAEGPDVRPGEAGRWAHVGGATAIPPIATMR